MAKRLWDLWLLVSRSAVCAVVFVPMWLSYFWPFLRMTRFGATIPDRVWARKHEAYSKRFYRLAVWMKGGLIKVGQILSTRVDILPLAWTQNLAGLQDKVAAAPWPVIREQLAHAYGAPPETLFASIEEEAVAAASFGQVHRAVTQDGREVALKIRYADIEAKLRVDLWVFGLGVRLFNVFLPNVDLRPIVQEMRRALRTELDYEQEARFTRVVHENFVERDGVEVPEVLDELTTGDVICTTWFEGRKITDPALLEADGLDRRVLLERLLWTWTQMMYVDGVFQSDPHPGNLLVRVEKDGPVLCVVDFGQVKILDRAFHQKLVAGVMAFALGNEEGFVESLMDLGLFGEKDRGRLEPVVLSAFRTIRAMDPSGDEPPDFGDLRHEVREAVEKAEGLVIPHELVLYGRTLGLLAGVTRTIAPDINALAIVQPLLSEALLAGGPPERPLD